MQHLPAPIHHARDAAQLPVAIDYPAALALRKMLLATLWNTGARINEALALTRGDFSLTPPYPFVQ
ncbi:TPA: phage integrase family protein, partial [Escherichia coli]